MMEYKKIKLKFNPKLYPLNYRYLFIYPRFENKGIPKIYKSNKPISKIV